MFTNPNQPSQPQRTYQGVVEVDRSFAKCRACHTATSDRHGIGPSLAGAYGRSSASAPNYRYSTALKESGLVWDAATLDKFLENPRAMVPGTKMSFAGLKDPLQRAQVIAYIERHSD
ncbi:cytochrome c family protein [Qipengyuania sp. 1NDH17]|uniref:Cytochrome c family protein n=1 Tax=Qipengyuania polymorpha TaxID=2867234 RepID=A0ABS7J355_9SPHN|nr:cytochrome c family protein [Qipengyuania polymorpha]